MDTLWTWGRAKNYRLGRDALGQDSRAPESVKGFDEAVVVSAACGGGHSAVVLESGELLVFGYSQYGQLGLGDRSDTHRPTQVILPPSSLSEGREDAVLTTEATGLTTARVEEVCCGRYHTIARSLDGTVYTWGGGKNGRLGHGDEKIRLHPGCIEQLLSQKAVAVTAGYHNNLVLTEKGDVWSWGWGAHGQLGLGDTRDREIPTIIDALSGLGVVSLSCGDRHSFAVTTEGAVYGWGSNEFGQLGTGERGDTLLSPTRIPALAGLVVVSMSCGDRHSAAVTNIGAVYTWGCGTDGQCGHGDFQDTARPRLVEALAHTTVVSVHCGHNFTMAVTNQGVVYSWGNNTYGQLGNGGVGKSADPVSVRSPKDARVNRVACAHFHCMLVIDPSSKSTQQPKSETDEPTNTEEQPRATPADKLAALQTDLDTALADYKSKTARCHRTAEKQTRELVLADILRMSSPASST